VVPGYGEHRWAERPEQRRGAGVLTFSATVRQVAARDDELGLLSLDEGEESGRHCRILRRAHVEIGDVEEAGRHGRWRL
jgi:hypothetical protein